MSTIYAKGTEVSIDKSQAEIRALLTKYGASGFMMGEEGDRAQVAFKMRDRGIIFRLPMPDISEFAMGFPSAGGYRGRPTKLSETDQRSRWERAKREKWRALVLCIKAKLETVESGIETFDEAFMAHLRLPSGETMGEWAAREENQRALFSANHPPLLTGPSK